MQYFYLASRLIVGYRIILQSDISANAIPVKVDSKKVNKSDVILRYPGEATKMLIAVVEETMVNRNITPRMFQFALQISF